MKQQPKRKTYRATVSQDDGWLTAEISGLRGWAHSISAEGGDLNELLIMARDVIKELTKTTDFTIALLVPPSVQIEARSASRTSGKRRRKTARTA